MMPCRPLAAAQAPLALLAIAFATGEVNPTCEADCTNRDSPCSSGDALVLATAQKVLGLFGASGTWIWDMDLGLLGHAFMLGL